MKNTFIVVLNMLTGASAYVAFYAVTHGLSVYLTVVGVVVSALCVHALITIHDGVTAFPILKRRR